MVTRRERVREGTKDEIKQAARRQIAEQGAPMLSLRAIAAEIGMTAPALYRYYANRDELVTALIVDAYHALADSIAAAIEVVSPEAHRERILVGCLAYREWAIQHPHDYALIFGTPIPGYVGPEEITVPAAARTMHVMVDVMAAAHRAGKLAPGPAYEALPAHMRKHLEQAAADYDGLAYALHIGTVAWTRMHGMVSLELFGHTQALTGDPGALYRAEIEAFIAAFNL